MFINITYKYIKAHFRYVDDIFIVFKGTNIQANVVVNSLNRIITNI